MIATTKLLDKALEKVCEAGRPVLRRTCGLEAGESQALPPALPCRRAYLANAAFLALSDRRVNDRTGQDHPDRRG
jgi:hypothetical protein